jgi:glycosyltransferase involved in cell wall biosynthesis
MSIQNLPTVSIITPAYNGADYIRMLIESVETQDYPNVEHVVIDDGSSDEGATLAILKSYSHLIVSTQENRGQYATMNVGLQLSGGDIVCFVNDDDLLLPGAIRTAVEYLIAHPDQNGVYGQWEFIGENGKVLKRYHPFLWLPVSTYPYTSNLYHGALFIRRNFILQHQLFFDPNLRFVGDYDWIIRLLKAGISLGKIDRKLIQFRLHSEQASTKSFQKMRREIFMVAKKHGLSLFLISLVRKVFFIAGLLSTWRSQGYSSMLKFVSVRMNRKFF